MYRTIYLAGPISGISKKESMDWRYYVMNRLKDSPIKVYSPSRMVDEEGIFSGGKAIKERDKNYVRMSDLVLVNVKGAEKVSIGTVMEIAWAEEMNKLILFVTDLDDNPHNHEMLESCISFWTTTLDEAIDALYNILLPS